MTPFGCRGSPATKPVPSPGMRPCCLLSPATTNCYGPGGLGPHRLGGSDRYGYVYTCHGGFIDIAHLRDIADLVAYYHHFLTVGGKNTAGATFAPFHYTGLVTITAPIPAAQRIEVAQSMAYDHSVFHELYTYWDPGLGAHHSSFSPEDCPSNFLGSVVGGRAIAAGGAFESAVAAELTAVLTALGAQPGATCTAAFGLISGRWIKGLGLIDAYATDYLLRRNFAMRPIDPWVVPGVAGCGAPAWPGTIPKEYSAAIRGMYDMELASPVSGLPWTRMHPSGFAAEITRIEAAASRPRPPGGVTFSITTHGYGPNYGTRWP